MKYYVFVDNFRGFTDTCIAITDVNFLVGENSTGKSSILALIKLISAPNFLLGGEDFGDRDIGFSHFLDMVSTHSPDQTYFRVGFVGEANTVGKRGKKEKPLLSGWLFTFTEREGQPRLHKCTFCHRNEEVTLQFGTAIRFKATQLTSELSAEEMLSRLRTTWVADHSGNENGYSKLNVPVGFRRNVPIFFALSVALAEASKQRKNKNKDEERAFPPLGGFIPPEITWFGPIRTEPKRTYDELSLEFSPEGRHTPYLIRRMLNSKSQATRLKEFIERVGRASGLFEGVRIKNFGRGATARFELDIVLDNRALSILNVGYGISQSLPIIVELLARARGSWFAIQEPEIHLHPRAQAALGDVLFEMAIVDGKRFLVETHSDFTIDRFRMNYTNGHAEAPESQILFFERRDKHNVVTSLPIGSKGDLPADQPDSYRKFFIREQMQLLGI